MDIISLATNLRKQIYWMIFVLLMFAPMIANFAFLADIVPIAQRLFPFWTNRPATLILSDILFIEGAVVLVFGALIGGVTLYNAWVPTDVRKAQFTEYIWNWKRIKEERNFPTGLLVGLILIVIGIIYLLAAFIITL
jgi:hypothetical protein